MLLPQKYEIHESHWHDTGNGVLLSHELKVPTKTEKYTRYIVES